MKSLLVALVESESAERLGFRENLAKVPVMSPQEIRLFFPLREASVPFVRCCSSGVDPSLHFWSINSNFEAVVSSNGF